jgi:hypothetical protein
MPDGPPLGGKEWTALVDGPFRGLSDRIAGLYTAAGTQSQPLMQEVVDEIGVRVELRSRDHSWRRSCDSGFGRGADQGDELAPRIGFL